MSARNNNNNNINNPIVINDSDEDPDDEPEAPVIPADLMATELATVQTGQVTIAGPPRPKPSVRSGRGRNMSFSSQRHVPHMYQPGFRNAQRLKNRIVAELRRRGGGPYCFQHVPVAVRLWFFMARPNSDFISKRRERGLRDDKSNQWIVKVPDVDNCVKFVLDAIKGVFFADDRQVVSVRAWKLQDNDGLCNGKTKIEVKAFREEQDYEEPTF